MAIRERTIEEILQSNSAGDSPREQSAAAKTNFGDVKAEPMPDWMPKRGETTFGYDAEMRLTRVTDVANKASTLLRDALGRVQSTSRPFDQDGDLPVLAETISNRFAYDFNGNMVSEADGAVKVTRYGYDQYDRRVRQIAPGSSPRRRSPATRWTPTATPPPSRRRLRRPTGPRLTAWTGYRRQPIRWATTRRLSTTRPPTRSRRLSRAATPAASQQGSRAKHTTTWTYNRAGDTSSTTTGLGDTTTYGYDRNANQVRVSAPGATSAPGASIAAQVTTRTFDGRDLPWATTTGSGTEARTTISEFDANGNPRRQINPRGQQPQRA